MKKASATTISRGPVLLTILGFYSAWLLSGCATNYTQPPPPISVSLSSTSASVQADIGTQKFTATVQYDSQNKGVNWTLTQAGANCSPGCGTLSANASASGTPITYTAPPSQPNPSTVMLTAISVADISKTMPATITVTPAVSVSVLPTPINVQFNAIQFFTATVQNDAANQGVQWALSGSGCSGSSCGTLSTNASASGVPIKYIGPPSVPPNPSVTLTATSVTDVKQSGPAVITVTVNPGTTALTVSPERAAITKWQKQAFTATVTGANDMTVTWYVDTIQGGNSTVGTMDANGNYTPPTSGTIAGSHTIKAISNADITKIVMMPIGVTDLPGVYTYHNDPSRDGANTQEYALTTSNVSTTIFGKLFSCPVDGAVYAQPLWAANLTMPNGKKHNVIFVATQHESVYAFDADASPCATLWHFSLIDAAHGGTAGETSVPSGHLGGLVGSGYGDIEAEVGVTGTPVIDPSTSTLYVVSKSVNASTQFFQRLHALDLTTGNEKLNGNKPVLISASVPGDGDGSSGGNVAFDPRNQHQRPGLALVNGIVYIAWASHEDHDPYHGWVIGYNASTLAQVPGAVFNTTPNHVGIVSYSRGGIWMGGGAPAADSGNNIYFITGNGTYDGLTNFGDSILRLSTSGGLSAADWFTPNDQTTLDQNDTDLGSGASTILVDLPSAPVHQLLIGGGKEGTLYLLDRTNLGHFTPTNSGVVQSFPASNGIFATPAFWQNRLYYAADSDTLKMFTLDPALGLFTPIAGPSATSHSSNSFGFPGSTPSVSATGAANGIVWALENSQYGFPAGSNGPAVLHAYDATNLNTELWNSSQAAANRDTAGNAVKFTVPTVANGKVYVGTRTELDVYGLLPN